ncbi:MAG: hypothetical protein HOV68_12280, partial [Streptomycetaceae bacterium]|nr:hypothetical protein [Streptomycetaceae bacterium]
MPNLRDAQRSEADPFARAQMWYAVAAWYDHHANKPGVARRDAADWRRIASAMRRQAAIGLKAGVLRAVAQRAERENLSGAQRAEFEARHTNAAKRLGNQRSKVKTEVGQLIDEGFGQQTPVLSNMPGNVGRAAYNRFIDATYADFTGADGPDIADAWSRLTRDLNLAGERAVRTMVLGDRSRRTRQQQRQTGRAAEPPSTAPAPGVVEEVMHSVAVAGALRARAEASAPASEDENTPYPREQLLGQARILELHAQQTLRREGLRAGENLTRSIVEDHARRYISGQRVSAREADRQRAAFQTSVAEHYRHEEQELDTPEARTVDRRAAEILSDLGMTLGNPVKADARAVAAFEWMAEADARTRAAQITNTRGPVRDRETMAASAEFAGQARAYATRHREAYAERVGPPVDGM